MNRLLTVLAVLLALAGAGHAQTKISELPSATPVATDVVPYVSEPAGTPVTKKKTVTNLLGVQHNHAGSDITSGTVGAARLPATTVNSVTNDTNVTGAISSQNLTLSWTGTLAKARQHAATVYKDDANTFGAFLQDLSASTFKTPISAGYAPTPSGLFGYDSTANVFTGGFNGTNRIFATRDATETLTNKTLTTPTIASFANATHAHQSSAGGGTLDAAAVAAGTLGTARLGSGSASSSTFLRGDQTWSSALVTSITGTSNQVTASASTGGVTLSLPQSIGTSSTRSSGNWALARPLAQTT